MTVKKPHSILLVNDEVVQRYRIASLLRRQGYEVKEAEDGAQAIDFISSGYHPSLVITDLYMPKVDGWQLCRFLLEKQLEVPILVISSYFSFTELEDILRTLGVQGYLRYPCSPGELLQKVRDILAGKTIVDQKTEFDIFLLSPARENFLKFSRAIRQLGANFVYFSSLKETIKAIKENNFSIGLVSSQYSPEEVLLLKQASPYLSILVLQDGPLKDDPFSYIVRGAKTILPLVGRYEYLLYTIKKELKERALVIGQELLREKTAELEEVNKKLLRIESVLKLVVEQATDHGLVVTDLNFNPFFANPKAESMFNISRGDQSFFGLLHSILGDFDPERIKEVIKKENSFNCEAKLGDKFLSLKIRYFYEKDGSISGYVFFFQDLTREKEMQDRLMEMQRVEAIATLSAGIAHDFNNILAAIRLKAELLQKQLSNSYTNYIEDILELCDRAAQVVRQVINAARPKEDEDLCDLNQQVREAVNFLRETIPREIDIHVELTDTSLVVSLSRAQLLQIIMNLTINAIQAMSGKGSLLIRTYSQNFDKELPKGYLSNSKIDHLSGEFACLMVKDTGIGISKEILPYIFEPYFSTKKQVQKKDKTSQPKSGVAGSGLGLSVTKKLVEEIGGIIALETQEGKGSTFYVYFPLKKNISFSDLEEKFTSFLNIADLKKEKIMIVEDEKDIAFSIANYLQSLGFSVQCCHNGEDVFTRLNQNFVPDLMLLDLNLPKLSGKEIIKKLRKMNFNFPIIVVTGYLSEEDRYFLERYGVAKILSKPFSFDQLRQVLCGIISEN